MSHEDNVNQILDGLIACHTKELLLLKLKENRPLRVKAGFDPTAPNLHLGHLVLLNKLKELQEMGHEIIFLVGDFTASIGDPTGKKATRPSLSAAQIQKNAETYTQQVFKILDPNKTKLKFNSEWMNQMQSSEWIHLASKFTVAQLLERKDFQNRLNSGISISFHELLYPMVQAQDSVALKADIELGGTDQLFNLMRGRDLQELNHQPPQVVMTLPLLIGTDGVEKMSKSLNNSIDFEDSADDQFGKTMSISDDLMWNWFSILKPLPLGEVSELKVGHPMDAKKRLAFSIVAIFKGPLIAQEAHDRWVGRFSQKKTDATPQVQIPAERDPQALFALLQGRKLIDSKKGYERLVEQGAIQINGIKVTNTKHTLSLIVGETHTIKVGKLKLETWIVT